MRTTCGRKALGAAALGFIAGTAFAADPAAGTLTDTSGPLQYTAGPFLVPNPTPDLALANQDPTCEPSLMNCDVYDLTIALPEDYAETHPDDSIVIQVGWSAIASDPVNLPDFDLYLYDESGKIVGQGANTNPEQIRLPIFGGTRKYQVKVMTYMPLGESITGTVVLEKATVEAESSSGGLLAAGSFGTGLFGLAFAALARRRRR